MSDCVFCKIASGDIESKTLHADDNFVAFHDLQPAADTHLLVIPRKHYDDLDAFVASGDDAREMLAFVAAAADVAGVAGGYRVITNIGPDAGQTMFHLHWHVLAGARLSPL
jgi:histidine triad (HIT) family protein